MRPPKAELERAERLVQETPELAELLARFQNRARRRPFPIGAAALMGIAAGYELGRARGLELVRAAVEGSAELMLQQLAAAPPAARRGRKRRRDHA